MLILWQVLAVALLFSSVVGFHELGHYLLARLYGMNVDEFSIGLGPKIAWRKTKTGTIFALRCIPLGGFVRVAGAEPKADGSEVNIPGGFFSRGPWRRAVVFFAGPLFSVLFGLILYVGFFFVEGVPSKQPILGSVDPDSPAAKAGLLPGDRVLAVNGRPVSTYQAVRELVRPERGPIEIRIQRGGQPLTFTVTPERQVLPWTDAEGETLFGEDGKPVVKEMGVIGVRAALVPYDLPGSATAAFNRSTVILVQSARVLFDFRRLKEEAGGPISIISTTSAVAKSGILPLVSLAAIISLSLGLLNLLPIPLLDGGQIVVAVIEGLRGGKRLSLKVQEVVATAGIGLLLLLMLSAVALDIRRLSKPDPQAPVTKPR